MNIIDFEQWLYFRLFNDKKYDPSNKMIYNFKIIFGKNLINAHTSKYNEDILNNLIPVIPKKKINKWQKILKKYPFIKKLK
jgi:hypothetical protein